jgi:hypothetical protein
MNPAPPPQPGGTAPVGQAGAAVSFSSPVAMTQTGSSATTAVAGAGIDSTVPVQLARSAGGGIVTISGRNLRGATSAALQPALAGLTATVTSVAEDGGSAVVTVSIGPTTPIGIVNIAVVTSNGTTRLTQVEIVP